MKNFKELGLNSEIIKSLDELGFVNPSPIQEEAIPFVLKSKKDLIALAQTGTGKTAAFGLPILNQMKAGTGEIQALILCPTRELCIQISRDINKLAEYLKNISITPVYGGERIDIQIRALKGGADIVVGTPGRVHDLIRRKTLKLGSIKHIVLDEADEMLDMGFKDDLDAILSQTPEGRQTLLFSATISNSVHSIAKRYMKNAHEISIGKKNVGAEKVSHEYYMTYDRYRFEALRRILDSLPGVYGILFCRTKRQTQEIADELKRAGYDAEALHGDIAQSMRTKIMDRFKQKNIRLLVATDVAARGIDVNDLTHVINYNLPDQDGAYTHRSGRTGRAQREGVCISILNTGEARRIKYLQNKIGKDIVYKKIPQGEDIYKKQIDSLISEIENFDIGNNINKKTFKDISDKLEKVKKEDLIEYIAKFKLSCLADAEKNNKDLNASFDSRGKRDRSGRKSDRGTRRSFRGGKSRNKFSRGRASGGFSKRTNKFKKKRY